MKKDSNNPSSSHIGTNSTPHVLGLWLKGMIKDGVVIKKKKINKESVTETAEIKDDDGGIINKIKRNIRKNITKFILIYRKLIKIDI